MSEKARLAAAIFNKWGTAASFRGKLCSNYNAYITCISSRKFSNLLPKKQRYFNNIKKLKDAHNVFDKMLESRPLPSTLLLSVSDIKQYSASVTLFNKMRVLGIVVDCYTMSIIINCFCQLKQVRYGFATFASFFKCGISAHEVVYCTLLKGLVAEDRTQEATELFEKLIRDQICQLDHTMFNIIIHGICKTRDYSKVNGLVALMEMEEKGFKPDAITYMTIVCSLCKDGRVDEAFSLFSEMIDKGIPPDLSPSRFLIQGLCNADRWKEVMKVLKYMSSKRIPLDLHTVNILVDALCKKGMLKEAESIIQIMPQKGINPDVFTYNSLIVGYVWSGHIDKAMQVFDSMAKERNISTYNNMLNGMLKIGKYSAAVELLNQMEMQGQTPDLCTYRISLNALCKNGQVVEALRFFKYMKETNVGSDVHLYNILIAGTIGDGKLDIARELFSELCCKGLKPDDVTYKTMINGLFRNGLVNEAKYMRIEMEKTARSSDHHPRQHSFRY